MGYGSCRTDGYAVGQWTSMVIYLFYLVPVLMLSLVLFVFSPVFFIFGFDYSFVQNTYLGPATRLGGFSKDPILADCELYYKIH
jgi:hypothetical protein